MTEDEMAGRHHRLNGHESEQSVGDSEGQGSLACCSPWGRIEQDATVTEQQKLKRTCLIQLMLKGTAIPLIIKMTLPSSSVSERSCGIKTLCIRPRS